MDSRARRPLAVALAGALAAALAACGGDGDAPALVRLTALSARLDSPPTAPATEVLREEFERVPEGWYVVTDSANPLQGDASVLRASAGREGGRAFVTLAGPRGALFRIVPAEPDADYLFEGELRARDLEPALEGARFWIGELASAGSPAEAFASGRGALLAARAFPSALGREGWQTTREAFRTGPETRALVIGCQLWMPDPREPQELERGEVDVERAVLSRIEERERWELYAARAVASAYRGDALPEESDARRRRRVDAMLAAEQRPSLLLLPGETLALELDVPEERPVLEAFLAPWPAAFRAAAAPTSVRVSASGSELARATVAAGATLAECGWSALEVDLAPLAGERVTIELAAEGEVPAVLGSPIARARPERAQPDAPWNVLLVSIDTLRADRVGAYGATSGATPRLDALARESVLFEDASANAPYTLPAHATLFSGQFPSVHAVEDAGRPLAPSRSPVLARILAERGYATQAFTAAGFLVPDFGFHAGFDGFAIRDPLRHAASRSFAEFERIHADQGPAPAEPGVARVRRWMREHAARPFFLFVHTYEVHDYDPPPGELSCRAGGCTSTLTDFNQLLFNDKNREPLRGKAEDREHLSHLYDAALAHVDAQVGELLDELDALGLAGRTLVVVTSDHGEELFERGFLQHGKSLHREVLAIPLIVRVPGRAAERVAEPVSQVDVAPTVLAALGLPLDPRMQGRDLLARRVQPLAVWSEVDDVRARQSSLREGGWKLVHAPADADVKFRAEREWSLYDLTRDPGERADASASEPKKLEEMRKRARKFQESLDAEGQRLGPPPSGDVDEETRKLLEGLGYTD